MKYLLLIIFSLCLINTSFAEETIDDVLSIKASKWRYKKEPELCKKIPEFIKNKKDDLIYEVIRNAGIFKIKSCQNIFNKNKNELLKLPGVKSALAFYSYRLGDENSLKILADIYDTEAVKIGDHWVIDLFGYLEDWDVSGVRLVRHAKNSDGAASEMVTEAAIWRCYLYGDDVFKENWFKIAKKEKADLEKIKFFYEDCKHHP